MLYTDLDVLMDPPGDPPPDKWLRWWHAGIHSFVKGPALVAGVPDHEAPLNSASLLIKPSAVAYEASLRIFDNIAFNRTTGFNGIGTPRALIDTLSDEKLSLLGVGFGENMTNISKVHDNIKRRLQRTAAYRLNHWNFAAGHIDQGYFFLLMAIMPRPIVTWAENNCRCSSRKWSVEHYWGPYKPWRPVSADTRTGATVRWLWNLGNASDPGVVETPCFVEMSEMRARVEAKGLWDAHTRSRGASFIHGQTVLPSVRLENFSVRGG